VLLKCLSCSVVLSVAVYDKDGIVDGAKVVALINKNKEEFAVGISNAVVGKSVNHSTSYNPTLHNKIY